MRAFQTPAERLAAHQAAGYGGSLERALQRSEARLAEEEREAEAEEEEEDDDDEDEGGEKTVVNGGDNHSSVSSVSSHNTAAAAAMARARWESFLRARFVGGRDDDFAYEAVDAASELDAVARREEEEAWFDDEEARWPSDDGDGGGQRTGETGVQDF